MNVVHIKLRVVLIIRSSTSCGHTNGLKPRISALNGVATVVLTVVLI